MAKKSVAEIRAELDELNAIMAKKRGSDLQVIAANRRQTESYRQSLSKALKGRVRTEEEIEKWRQSYDGHGEKNGMFGKNHTDASRKLMSEKLKNRPAHNKGKPRTIVKCPHCATEGGEGIMHRWHFDNCKYK